MWSILYIPMVLHKRRAVPNNGMEPTVLCSGGKHSPLSLQCNSAVLQLTLLIPTALALCIWEYICTLYMKSLFFSKNRLQFSRFLIFFFRVCNELRSFTSSSLPFSYLYSPGNNVSWGPLQLQTPGRLQGTIWKHIVLSEGISNWSLFLPWYSMVNEKIVTLSWVITLPVFIKVTVITSYFNLSCKVL